MSRLDDPNYALRRLRGQTATRDLAGRFATGTMVLDDSEEGRQRRAVERRRAQVRELVETEGRREGWSERRMRAYVARILAFEADPKASTRPVCSGCGLVKGIGQLTAAGKVHTLDPDPPSEGETARRWLDTVPGGAEVHLWFCGCECLEHFNDDLDDGERRKRTAEVYERSQKRRKARKSTPEPQEPTS